MLLLAAGTIILLALPLAAQAAGQPVLLVYRLESERTSIAGVLSACGYQVTAIAEDKYSAASLTGCASLVTTSPKPCRDGLDAGIPVLCIGPRALPAEGLTLQTTHGLEGVLHVGKLRSSVHFEGQAFLITEYTGAAVGEMEFPLRGTFPYGVIRDSIACVPHFFEDDIQPLALGLIARQLLGDAGQGRLFLLIDEVYPFSDLGMLCHMADELYARGYPFTVSAMPVYDNLDYPAYLRYTQVLRYIQSRGGAVVMHDPIIRAAEIEAESMDERLQRARASFEQQGILLANGIVSPYPISLAGFSNISSALVPFGPLPMDVAIDLPIAKTPGELNQALAVIGEKWVAIASLQRMVTDAPFIYNEQPIDDQFTYREEVQTSFNRFFSAGNQTLLAIVLISLTVFSGLLTGGYFLYRRKFYR